MKKILLPILISASFFISTLSFGQAGSITIGIQGNACDQLIVEWNSTYSFVGVGQNQWTQATMTIAWPQALGAGTLGTITSLLPGFGGWQYNGAAALVGSEYKREIILISGGYQQDIPTGVTEVIAITLEGTGTGNFNLSTLNPAGVASTNISSGNFAGEMWSSTFNPATAVGVSLDDKIVWDGTEWCGGTGGNDQPGNGDTKPCYITGLNGSLTEWDATVGSLDIQVGADLTIESGGSLTNTGNTTISQPQGLIIGADASGSGSYIDNGTITYVGSGSAKVQTFIANSATPGNFHIHQIGPTVINPAFGSSYPSQTGVFLSEFELALDQTYAYMYNEPLNNWLNIYQDTEPVPTACGIIFSDISGAPTTHDMVGELATDDGGMTSWITTPSAASTLGQWALTYTPAGGQGNFHASNPYPSGLDLKTFWNTYSATMLGTTMRIWDEPSGNYAAMTFDNAPPPPVNVWVYTLALNGTGGLINPGQGFFFEALSSYTGTWGDQAWFFSTMRAHYHGPFIKGTEESGTNRLRLTASNDFYKDELVVYFAEGSSFGMDMYDAEKWASMYEDALEISSLSTDMAELTINSMPELDEMMSIPVNFEPGLTGDFAFTFSELDSFDPGIEIYLEDIQVGGDWINVISNPVYEFSGNIDDNQERFVLHFFNTTGIDNPEAEINNVQIYAWGHDAYIVNKGKETVREYVAYDMMGRELHRGTLPNSTVNKVTISDISAYYIVKVFTKEGRIYTDKVYINK